MLHLNPFRVPPAVPIVFPLGSGSFWPLNLYPCFYLLINFFFFFLYRAGSDEIDGQKAGKNGHHAGSPEAAHPAAGPAAPRPGGSQDPSTSHAR